MKKWWWVFTFAIVAYGLYEQAAMKLEKEISNLDKQIESLKSRIEEAKAKHRELALQQESLNDPAWIELTLIRTLGMVPEGYTKVYYRP